MSDSNPYGKPDSAPGAVPPGFGPPQPGFGPPQPGYGYPPPGPAMGPGYPAAGVYAPDPNAPYGYDIHGRVYSEKSKIVAGVLQLALGGFGVGRFYAGSVGIGLAQLFTCGGLGIWALIDGVMYLVSSDRTDSQGRILRG